MARKEAGKGSILAFWPQKKAPAMALESISMSAAPIITTFCQWSHRAEEIQRRELWIFKFSQAFSV